MNTFPVWGRLGDFHDIGTQLFSRQQNQRGGNDGAKRRLEVVGHGMGKGVQFGNQFGLLFQCLLVFKLQRFQLGQPPAQSSQFCV